MPIATPQGTLDFKSVDKVTFVGASSNTVIDTTTGSLGVGVDVNGPTSNLHVVGDTRLEGDINMLHTSNTASIKLNSNVVAEFPRSKKLIKYPRVALTSASRNAYENGYKVTFSSEYDSSTWAAEHVFDNSLEDGSGAWASGGSRYGNNGQTYSAGASIGGFDGEYVHLELPVSINLSLVRMLPRTYALPCPQAPKVYIIIASTDGVTYDLLKRITNDPDTGTFNEILINTPKLYNRFAVVIEKTISSDLAGITEIEYFGTPEYDPEAHGTDVTIKSVANVPNTDWLEVYYDAKNYTIGAVQDETSNNRDATLDGVVHDPVSKSFTFDGGNDKIHMGPFSNFTPTSSYTVSLWFKVPEISSGEDILFHFGHGTGGESFGMNVDNGKLGVFIWDGTSVKTQANIFTATKWVHTTCIANSDGTVEIYFNGRLVLSGDTGQALTIPTNPYLSLGIHFSGEQTSFQSGGFFKGSIANFRLFNRALTSDEIYQLYAYQKEDFGHGDLSMTLKAGRLGIGTSEPRAALDVRGTIVGASDRVEIGGALLIGVDGKDAGSTGLGSRKNLFIQSTFGGNTSQNYGWWIGAQDETLTSADNDLHFTVIRNGTTTQPAYIGDNGNTIRMNFTGQHRTFIKDVPFSQAGDLEGLIVSSDQNKYIKMSGGIEAGSNAITTNESLPVVSLSNVVTDKKCFGVISASEDPEERSDAFGSFVSVTEKEKGDTRVYINSVGEGAIWVSNIGGNLEAGDYITTSNVAGYGQKQESDSLKNYTVAKITMDCDFNPATQSIQIIKKDEEDENVLDEHGQIQWEDHPTETEKAYKVRYLTADGAQTDEANTVHIAAFVGCTYHCG
jgi:hypothetical protein